MSKTISNKSQDRKAFWKKLWFDYGGALYMIPVVVGILCFTIIPMITSLNYAFHDYNPYAFDESEQLVNFGIQNFKTIFTKGAKNGTFETVMQSLYVTFRYAILNILISLITSYALALFLNHKTAGIKVFRVVYYLPCCPWPGF